jgi:hypothetical protein
LLNIAENEYLFIYLFPFPSFLVLIVEFVHVILPYADYVNVVIFGSIEARNRIISLYPDIIDLMVI